MARRVTITKMILVSLAYVASMGLLLFAYNKIQHQSTDGEERQGIEESLADDYLSDQISIIDRYIERSADAVSDSDMVSDESPSTEETDTSSDVDSSENKNNAPVAPAAPVEGKLSGDYSDDNYYSINGVVYTPEYAVGYIDCVLEIPCIKMRRGVYTGNKTEIKHNLNIWMTVTSRPGYKLGETHYCIYGHNSTAQSLSFNRLHEVRPGEYFTLTKDGLVYVYAVTDFFPIWRESINKRYVDNFALPSTKCYIFTCGRGEYRYRDICVEGTLEFTVPLSDWDKGEYELARSSERYEAAIAAYEQAYNDYLKLYAEYIAMIGQTEEQSESESDDAFVASEEESIVESSVDVVKKTTVHLDVRAESQDIIVSITDENGNCAEGVEFSILGQDGYAITDEKGDKLILSSNDHPYSISIDSLKKVGGEVVIAVTDMDYVSIPDEKVVTIAGSNGTSHIVVDDVGDEDETETFTTVTKIGIMLVAALVTVAFTIAVISIFRKGRR